MFVLIFCGVLSLQYGVGESSLTFLQSREKTPIGKELTKHKTFQASFCVFFLPSLIQFSYNATKIESHFN